MRKTSTRMILWFLIVIALTAGVIVVTVNRSLSYQFRNFIVSTSDQQIETIVDFIENEHEKNGWSDGFDTRLAQLAQASNMNVKLTDISGETVIDFEYRNQRDSYRRGMPMHMHKDWKDEFEAYWPTKSVQVVRSADGEQIGILELDLHDLDDAVLPAMDFQRNMTRSIFRAVFVAMGLSIILGLFLARTFSKPLRAMTQVANDMKRGGLNKRVSEKQNTTELSELAASLNHLSNSLEVQQELRTRLASDLSHEIRTPLSVLKSHLEAIRDGIWVLDDKNMDILLRETERLINMAEQIRFIEDIESHELQMNLTEVKMKSWLTGVVEYFSPDAYKQGKTLVLEGDDPLVTIDQDKFKQILFNLIANALNHTESGDKISVRLIDQPSKVVLEIEDSGKGIEAEELDHVFERLYRSESARSRRGGGSGLGLAVVKSLVEAHGYTVNAVSQVNKGTIMRISMIK